MHEWWPVAFLCSLGKKAWLLKHLHSIPPLSAFSGHHPDIRTIVSHNLGGAKDSTSSATLCRPLHGVCHQQHGHLLTLYHPRQCSLSALSKGCMWATQPILQLDYTPSTHAACRIPSRPNGSHSATVFLMWNPSAQRIPLHLQRSPAVMNFPRPSIVFLTRGSDRALQAGFSGQPASLPTSPPLSSKTSSEGTHLIIALSC